MNSVAFVFFFWGTQSFAIALSKSRQPLDRCILHILAHMFIICSEIITACFLHFSLD
jgi:threonine aldolase